MTTKSVLQATWPGISITLTGMGVQDDIFLGRFSLQFILPLCPSSSSSLPGITERVEVPGCVPRSAEFCPGASLSASGTLAFFLRWELSTSKKEFLVGWQRLNVNMITMTGLKMIVVVSMSLFFQGVLSLQWHWQLPSIRHANFFAKRPWGYCWGDLIPPESLWWFCAKPWFLVVVKMVVLENRCLARHILCFLQQRARQVLVFSHPVSRATTC